MKDEVSSKTAEQMALSRAIESRKPLGERICDDPYAVCFLSEKYRLLTLGRPMRAATVRLMDFLFPGHHGYVLGRTRYIDDLVSPSVAEGFTQLVILGAGFDSRAYRLGALQGLSIFDVDHPATQARKKATIHHRLRPSPANVTYVPMDFRRNSPHGQLSQHGYDAAAKTVFIWEGTTPYLTADAVDEMLGFVARRSGDGSRIVFDYIFQSVVEGTCQLEGARNEFRKMARTSEPLTFGIGKQEIDSFLSTRGFANVKDVGADFLSRAYFQKRRAGTKIKTWWRIVHASTCP